MQHDNLNLIKLNIFEGRFEGRWKKIMKKRPGTCSHLISILHQFGVIYISAQRWGKITKRASRSPFTYALDFVVCERGARGMCERGARGMPA